MIAALLTDLAAFAPADQREHADCARIITLINEKSDACFYRDYFDPGHITGSALLISADGGCVLMNHHGTLDKWLCFGGHADGEIDIFNVARRELSEESGLEDVVPAFDGIFDLDVHAIPENPVKGEPAHEHFDIRYLFRVSGNGQFTASDESHELRWCDFDEALALTAPLEQSRMQRMLHKWKNLERERG